MFFCEETAAYRLKGEVPLDPDYLVPIGKSRKVCEGDAITVVGFGTAILKATRAAELLREEGIHIDLIDLRSLRPLDLDPVVESVKRTGRLLIVDEFTETFGITGEIAFQVTQKAFSYLKGPAQRYTLPGHHHPRRPHHGGLCHALSREDRGAGKGVHPRLSGAVEAPDTSDNSQNKKKRRFSLWQESL